MLYISPNTRWMICPRRCAVAGGGCRLVSVSACSSQVSSMRYRTLKSPAHRRDRLLSVLVLLAVVPCAERRFSQSSLAGLGGDVHLQPLPSFYLPNASHLALQLPYRPFFRSSLFV